jgi:hypothetical protein
MPAQPKSKKATSPDVLVWNRSWLDSNARFHARNVILNYQAKGDDDRPTAVIHPVTPGLARVPRRHIERALADAKAVGADHQLSTLVAAGRLVLDVDLESMPERDALEAVEQTASKGILEDIMAGKLPASEAVVERVTEIRRTWGGKNPPSMKMTQYLSDYARVS